MDLLLIQWGINYAIKMCVFQRIGSTYKFFKAVLISAAHCSCDEHTYIRSLLVFLYVFVQKSCDNKHLLSDFSVPNCITCMIWLI